MLWDVFCRVIDNHGDLGVCWRLARRLVALGHRVRLWVDDASALAWMAPRGAEGVEVLPWREPEPHETPGEVVIESFGCDPPPGFLARMAQAAVLPVWINLEYLSAESYVERSHGLASPQMAGPARGLTKWFFYPGFSEATGGLLREPALDGARDEGWLARIDPAARPEACRVSLFCYENPALPAALEAWREGSTPVDLYLTPGHATRQAAQWLGTPLEAGSQRHAGALRLVALPWLEQPDYDRLLAACELNFVRGEDSFVRALWAGRPFVWQIYPQRDGVHAAKLEAFLDVYVSGAPTALAAALRRRFAAWNGLADAPAHALPDAAWTSHAAARAQALASVQRSLGDLGERLLRFALAKR
ncbi:elongation factor P maturation arginine rhamnosyltransferase EarP [Caldimonas sp. KR1-144]|uniref:elongation factor P maturation arginine rhamnosyltransferase EarP n=1 Tax=Caldimonas sp. KR1-144 TaxID=3400911 RepID=UPI003C0E87A9